MACVNADFATDDDDVQCITTELQTLIAGKGIKFLAEFYKIKTEKWRDEKIQIGVFGESGSGKSTFLNTVRGLGKNDEGYAEQGCKGNTTKEATTYTIKENKNIVFIDCVGCGTVQYERGSKYIESLNMKKFDFVLLMSNKNFSQDDAWFAKEICEMEIPLFFVRTKFDEILRSAKADGENEENIHKEILATCAENIKESGIPPTRIYIISSYDTSVGDWQKLMTEILNTLPQNKKVALLKSIPATSHQLICDKKKELIKRIHYISVMAAVATAIPLPFLDVSINIAILISEAKFYLNEFSLSEDKIGRICKRINLPLDFVLIKLPYVRELMRQGYEAVIFSSIQSEMAKKCKTFTSKLLVSILPLIGPAISSSVAYCACFLMLKNEIDTLEKEAHILLDEVLLSLDWKNRV